MTIVVSISEVSVWAKTEEGGIWPLSATWDTWLFPALQRSCFMLITKLLGMQGITITEGDFCVGGNSMIQTVSSALRQKISEQQNMLLLRSHLFLCLSVQAAGESDRKWEFTEHFASDSLVVRDSTSTARGRREERLCSGTQLPPLVIAP